MTFQEHAQSLLVNIQDLNTDETLSDLEIVCDDGSVRSHRLLLSCCSSLVHHCLQSSHLDCDTLLLPGVSVADVSTFLSCLFTVRLSPSPGQVDSVIRVLLVLGVNVAPYVDVRPGQSDLDLSRKPHQPTDQQVIVIPPGLDVLKIQKKDDITQHQEKSYTMSYQVNEKDEIVAGPKFFCDKCSTDFDNEADLENHNKQDCSIKKDAVNNTLHSCNSCNKMFSCLQTYTNHVKLHAKDLKFKCDVCSKSFVSKSVLGNHLKTHDNNYKVPRFNCNHCEKVFNHPSNLKRHIRTAHFELSDKKLFPCSECGKQFKDPSARNGHQKFHLDIKPYVCQVCSKTFTSNFQLEAHRRTHTGEKPFACNVCGRCFTTKTHLKSHKLHKHSAVKIKGLKSHLCQECGQSFVKEYDLRVHMRKHTGERPFECSECGKSFASEKNFINHKRIHSGEKPYSCDTCLKTFSTCSGLRQHFKAHANCRANATDGAYSLRDKKALRYGRDTLEAIPELSMDAAAGLQNLENFTVAELKEEETRVAEETVVYFNTDSTGLNIAGLEGVTIQALEMEVSDSAGGQVLSLVQIDEGMEQNTFISQQ